MTEAMNKTVFMEYFKKIMEPIEKRLPTGAPMSLKIGTSGTIYSERIRQAEGFLRLLWGYAGYYRQHPVDDTFHLLIEGIKAGTDSTAESYWGDVDDVNQLMVEMAPLAVFILMNEEACKADLTEEEQTQIVRWLDQINYHRTAQNNWLFFRVLVNVCLEQCFQLVRQESIKKDLATIETFYLGNGWYYDGVTQQRDYYISFAIQYYSLLYAYFCKETDPTTAAKFRQRACDFAETFRYWFDSTGRGLPFGRSLTYRFAQASFWSALLLVVPEASPAAKAEAKYFLFRNLEQWLTRDIFSTDGFLKIGYFYENLIMAEEYNAPGSPYWALKAFILFAATDESIWELPAHMRSKERQKLLPEAQMIVTTSADGAQIQAFPVGQYVEKHSQGEAKYSKFVYDSFFGFSVAKGGQGWNKGGFDNVLAVSEQDEFFRVCTKPTKFSLKSEYTYRFWQPWEDVGIHSFIIPLVQGHLRVHQVDSKRSLTLRDGGFALPYEGESLLENATNFEMTLNAPIGRSQAVSLDKQMVSGCSDRLANQSLYFPCAQLPYLTVDIPAGKGIYCNFFAGEPKASSISRPQITLDDGKLEIISDWQKMKITLKEWQG